MPGYEIARRTGLSPATVSRILRRARLSRWRDLNPPPPIQRYEHPRPGDLLHLDIKGMTRFSEVSLRGDGRLRGKRKHPGFLALHVAVDDHSRMAFTQMLPDQKAETTIGFPELGRRVLRHPRHRRARPAHRQRFQLPLQQFRQACQPCTSNISRTRPYTPRTNGKAERFIQTALREWAYAQHWSDSEQRDAHLQPWTDYYNRERPHGSLNYKPPISRSDPGTTS
jgi:transposase InsO family protein